MKDNTENKTEFHIESPEILRDIDCYVDMISLAHTSKALIEDDSYFGLITMHLETKFGAQRMSQVQMPQNKANWANLWEEQSKKFLAKEVTNYAELPAQICLFLIDPSTDEETLINLIIFAGNINPFFQSIIIIDPYEVIYSERYQNLLPKFISAGLIPNILNLEEKKGRSANTRRRVTEKGLEVYRETQAYKFQGLDYLNLLIDSEANKQQLIRKSLKSDTLLEFALVPQKKELPIRLSDNAEVDPTNSTLTINGEVITLSDYEYLLIMGMLSTEDNILYLTHDFIKLFIKQEDTQEEERELIRKAKGNVMVLISRLRPLLQLANIKIENVRKKRNSPHHGGYKLVFQN